MRTTVRIEDDLLNQLKQAASQADVSLTAIINQTLRKGLTAKQKAVAKDVSEYREKTYSMGKPLVDLTKALSLAAALDDEERLAKMDLGK